LFFNQQFQYGQPTNQHLNPSSVPSMNQSSNQSAPPPSASTAPLINETSKEVLECRQKILDIQAEVNRLIGIWTAARNSQADMKKQNLETAELITQQQLKLDTVEIPSDASEATKQSLRQFRRSIIIHTEQFLTTSRL